MSGKIHGETQGLKASQIKQLEKLYQRRIPAPVVVTQEFAHQLTSISQELNRKAAVLVNRKGQVSAVLLGDAQRVYLPDLGRQRGGGSRLRGVRLIVTSFEQDLEALISRDELTDLTKLKLDMVVGLEVTASGHPGALSYAHLLPGRGDARWMIQNFDQVSSLDLDFREQIKALESELSRKADRRKSTGGAPAVLVHVNTGERDAKARVQEMLELCSTAGVEVLEVVEQRRHKIDRRFVIGSGKLEELELICLDLGTDLVLFDRDLTPPQSRAISERSDLRVLDRTQLILDIFAQRARSHDGKLQVELAQLKYTLPKLIQRNTAMSRLTGGIGGRGPGETKLEINRRRAHSRINRLERDLAKLSKRRQLQRSRRGARAVPVIALVGYTNAGKSTLLNALTNAEVLAEDKLFATLDPTSRRLRFPNEREVVLSDTVGFIRDLPKDLVAAFKSTLEELDDADILVHVVDITGDDLEFTIGAVRKILDQLSLSEKKEILVFNKADLLDEGEAALTASLHEAIALSATHPESLGPLLEAIDETLWQAGKPEPFEQEQWHEEVSVREI